MENLKKIPPYKWLMAILCLISATVFAVAVLISSVGHAWDLRDGMERKSQSFLETPVFQELAKEYIGNLAKYTLIQENFQKASSFDEDKEVDIFDYVERNAITGENYYGLLYRLGDLRAWQKSASTYDVNGLTELVSPIGFQDIQEFVDSDANGLDFSVDEWKQYVSNALKELKKDLDTYTYSSALLKKGNTNFRYIVTNTKTGNVYSNTDLAAAQLLAQPQYFRFRTGEYSIDANMNLSAQIKYEIMEELGNDLADLGEYEVIVSIDTDFPAKDKFQDVLKIYEQWNPLLEMAFWMLLIGGLLTLVFFCGLCTVVGRVEGMNEVALQPLDKIKLECLFFLILITIGGYSAVLFALASEKYNISLMIGGTALVSIFAIAFFLLEIFSLVRRAKAKIFWKRSYSYIIYQGFRSGMKHAKQSRKTLLIFIVYLLMSFLFLNIGLIGDILLIFMNLYVASRTLRRAAIREEIMDGVKRISDGDLEYQIPTDSMGDNDRELTEAINRIGDGLQKAVKSGIKNERLKSDLITNVSHDIKTPLTSIINYVGLLKRENIENPKVQNYIEILDAKSQRLKHLTEDLVEASRISSGNIEIVSSRLNFKELISQIEGEFIEKFENRDLEIVKSITLEPIIIMADGRRLWRILENIYNNVAKYAMPGTRVYIDARIKMGWVYFSVKNISEYALNIQADELSERFIRGDVSRSTEGSGLGLSIAKSLTTLQHGTFDIYLDGDLFKATVRFPVLLGKAGDGDSLIDTVKEEDNE